MKNTWTIERRDSGEADSIYSGDSEICIFAHDNADGYNNRNARLIAAAPELLAALRQNVEMLEYISLRATYILTGDPMNNQVEYLKQHADRGLEDARAAIAKADGR